MSDKRPGIRPRPTIRRRLDIASRAAFPAVCTALLLLALAGPLRLPAQAQWLPAVAMACVFFWSLFRPASMAPPVVFAIGALVDLLGLEPIGIWTLLLLLVHHLAVRWRALGRQGFLVVWLAFVAAAAAASALSWALTSLLLMRPLPTAPAIALFGLAAGLYPPLAALLTAAHRGPAAPEKA